MSRLQQHAAGALAILAFGAAGFAITGAQSWLDVGASVALADVVFLAWSALAGRRPKRPPDQ